MLIAKPRTRPELKNLFKNHALLHPVLIDKHHLPSRHFFCHNLVPPELLIGFIDTAALQMMLR
jgi:hypothetical protein